MGVHQCWGRSQVRVDRKQRSLWLGHSKKDATSWYESHDPEFLPEASRAMSIIVEKLDALTSRALVPMTLSEPSILAVIKTRAA